MRKAKNVNSSQIPRLSIKKIEDNLFIREDAMHCSSEVNAFSFSLPSSRINKRNRN